MNKYKQGFTLIELLVVILIIGVLAAVALPQYNKALKKSRFSALMPIAKAMALGNETYYLETGTYATGVDTLSVAKSTDELAVNVVDDIEQGFSYVMVYNEDALPNNKYIIFQNHSEKFAGTTMCEAGDDEADKLCEAFGGVSLGGSISGGDWVAYLLSGSLSEGSSFAVCEGKKPADIKARLSGATGTASCVNGEWQYKWTGGREYKRSDYCMGSAENVCAGGIFGEYNNFCQADKQYSCRGSTFSGEFSTCRGYSTNGCADSIFSGSRSSCEGWEKDACHNSSIVGGGYCLAKVAGGCDGVKYTANKNGVTGCCAGNFCPSGSPKCATTDYSKPIWNEQTQAIDIIGTW